jgi:hypothetical protein
VSSELQSKRSDIQAAQKDLDDKNARLQYEKTRQQAMHERRENAKNSVMTLEQRNAEVICTEYCAIN